MAVCSGKRDWRTLSPATVSKPAPMRSAQVYPTESWAGSAARIEQQENHLEERSAGRQRTALLQAAQFLQRELPVRLAYAVRELDKVSCTGILEAPPVQEVRRIYLQNFQDLRDVRTPEDRQTMANFGAVLSQVHERAAPCMTLMAKGLQQLRAKGNLGMGQGGHADRAGPGGAMAADGPVQGFLEHFYQNRVAQRFLCGQFLAMISPPREGHVGLICRDMDVMAVAEEAVDDASYLCRQQYRGHPRVILSAGTPAQGPVVVDFIPEYLHYVLVELLKNAMRAVMEHQRAGATSVPAPVQLVVSQEAESVLITVSDKGTGIDAGNLEKIWSYLYTTAGASAQEEYLVQEGGAPDGKTPPLAGLGYGLPVSRLYARQFGGDVSVTSEAGAGTTAVVRIPRRGAGLEPIAAQEGGAADELPQRASA